MYTTKSTAETTNREAPHEMEAIKMVLHVELRLAKDLAKVQVYSQEEIRGSHRASLLAEKRTKYMNRMRQAKAIEELGRI